MNTWNLFEMIMKIDDLNPGFVQTSINIMHK